MIRLVAADDARVMAVREALEPHPWPSFSTAVLCRHALDAMDDAVDAAAHRTPGRVSMVREHADPLLAAKLREERVDALIAHVERFAWQTITLGFLSRQLVSAAEDWRHERAWFDIRLSLLLSDGIG